MKRRPITLSRPRIEAKEPEATPAPSTVGKGFFAEGVEDLGGIERVGRRQAARHGHDLGEVDPGNWRERGAVASCRRCREPLFILHDEPSDRMVWAHIQNYAALAADRERPGWYFVACGGAMMPCDPVSAGQT